MGRKPRFLLLAVLTAAVGWGLAGMPRSVFRQMHEVRPLGEKLIYYKEDLLGTVTVAQTGPYRRLLIDNLEVANTGNIGSHTSLGHLPMLLHPNPQTVYVLGFGGGGTAYAVSTYPEVQRIDATELSRSVVDAAGLFDEINCNVMSDPRLNLEVNDGRHFLLTTRRSYDVISVDLLWPQTAGSGSLYTKEFYQLCHRRLGDDGIMVEWLSPGFIPGDYLRVVLRTIRSVFPHTSLWWTRRQEHLLMVASKAPLRIDAQRLAQRMSHPAVERDLAEAQLAEPTAFLGCFIAADEVLAEFVKGSDLLNTDDLPLLEYKLPFYTRGAGQENIMAMIRLQQSVLPLLDDLSLSSEQKKQILICEQSNLLLHEAMIAQAENQPEDAIAALLRKALQVYPENHDAAHMLGQLGLDSP